MFNYMVRPKDFSLTGAILIVASQLFSSFKSSENISQEIEKFRHEFQQSLIDRETYFVRKTELTSIGKKIDVLNSKMIKLTEQINSLKSEYYSSSDDEDPIVGCAYRRRKYKDAHI